MPNIYYVIATLKNNKPKFLANTDICDRNWTFDIDMAKKYIDLSAAEIKTANVRNGHNAVDAVIRVIKNGKLCKVERSRYGR